MNMITMPVNRAARRSLPRISSLSSLLAAVLLSLPSLALAMVPLDLASGPLITPGASPVKPNLMFTLDDSGSMRWDFLPDWAYNTFCKNAVGTAGWGTAALRCCRQPNGTGNSYDCLPQDNVGAFLDGATYGARTDLRGMPPFHTHTTYTIKTGAAPNQRNETLDAGFNSAYYNPAITYRRPIAANGNAWPIDGAGNSLPDFPINATPWDGYGVQYNSATQTIDLANQFPDVEWCTDGTFTNCLRADNYLVPGVVAGNTYATMRAVRATGTGNFAVGTPAAPAIAANRDVGPYYYVMVPGEFCTNRKLTHCVASPVATTVAGVLYNHPAALRWCNNAAGRDRRVDGALAGVNDRCQAVRNNTFAAPRYPTLRIGGVAGSATPTDYVSGRFLRIDIVAGGAFRNICVDATGVVSHVAGACPTSATTVLDRDNRTDCASRPNCTQAEELRNFANWFAWYRSRMQATKSAVSIAFQSVDDRYRVGFMTINNSTGSTTRNLRNIANFDTATKMAWYNRLFAINPAGATPLRESLARAGRIFAGQNVGIGATDPVQYSCQKNFNILTTDGYWNGNNGVRLNGATAIANEDSTGMVIGGVTGPFADNWTATLADVAAYYYKTDLRTAALGNCTGALGAPGGSVCTDNVPTSTGNMNAAQHMVTYGISLGIDGLMQYRADYKTASTDPTDDFTAVSTAVTADPANGICSWQNTGACNWPQPAADSQANIDDLWHAAVNGHGSYLNAKNPLTMSQGLRDMIKEIFIDDGGGAAATTSNPNVTTGDNFVFSSKYWTQKWIGELHRETMDETNGTISSTANDWKAHDLLDTAGWGSRKLYTFNSGGVPRDFAWGALTNTGPGCNPPANEQGCFTSTYIDGGLAQFCAIGPLCLSGADQLAAAGAPLVDYLRGDKGNEDTGSATGFYRKREGRLGDIVNSEAVYVGKYLYDYGTSVGYPARGTPRADPAVYVAANDGMLHAFNAGHAGVGGGQERWAYIPSMVVRDLHRLADKDYDTKHRYLVDGTPVVGDVKDGSDWKTILVGGLAGGGPGYYALDITSQTAPKVLWEFRQKFGCTATLPPGAARYAAPSGLSRMNEDCDLGHSYGNPVITKLPNGTWVVMVTSGYNNHTNGDGKGYLYILDAMTGALLHKVTTGVGDTNITTGPGPSGLGKINAWVDAPMKDNTAKYVYGGDLLGNMWKFDLTSGTPVKSLLINVGASKPITAKPELGQVTTNAGQKKRVVFFPTGRLLGNSDLSNTATQSFYGIWDTDGATPANALVSSVVSGGGNANRTGNVLPSVFDNDANPGWQMDFPVAGERGNTDPTLAFGTLVFSTNKPTTADPCSSGFVSRVYNIDYRSGGVVNQPGGSSTHVATYYAGAATRPNVVVLPSGAVKSITRITGQDVKNFVEDVRIDTTAGKVRRVSWRELQK